MYSQAGAQNGAAAGANPEDTTGASTEGDNVVDADYEVEDNDNKE